MKKRRRKNRKKSHHWKRKRYLLKFILTPNKGKELEFETTTIYVLILVVAKTFIEMLLHTNGTKVNYD